MPIIFPFCSGEHDSPLFIEINNQARPNVIQRHQLTFGNCDITSISKFVVCPKIRFNEDFFPAKIMARVVKLVKGVRNHWKKSVFGAAAVTYGINYAIEVYK